MKKGLWISSIVFLVVIMGMGIQLYRQQELNREVKSINEQLKNQKEELEDKKENLESQKQQLDEQNQQSKNQNEKKKEQNALLENEYKAIQSQLIGYMDFKEEMNITDTSVVQVYRHTLDNQFYIVEVSEDKDYLFFVLSDGKDSTLVPIRYDNDINYVYAIEFYEWEEKIYVEVDAETKQGDGNIYLYRVEDGTIENILVVQNAIDHHIDSINGSVYQNEKLSLDMEKDGDSSEMPLIELQGIQFVYEGINIQNQNEESLVHQSNFMEYIYQWDSQKQTYVLKSEKTEVLQQM